MVVAYDDLIKAFEKDNRSKPIKQTIAFIKEQGAQAGQIITDEEMASKINMPLEQWQTYTSGETDTPQEIHTLLFRAYQELFKIYN